MDRAHQKHHLFERENANTLRSKNLKPSLISKVFLRKLKLQGKTYVKFWKQKNHVFEKLPFFRFLPILHVPEYKAIVNF